MVNLIGTIEPIGTILSEPLKNPWLGNLTNIFFLLFVRSPRKTRSGGGSSKRSFDDFVGVSNRIAALEDKFKRPRV